MKKLLRIIGCAVVATGAAGGAHASNAGATADGVFTFQSGPAQAPVLPFVVVDDFNSGLPGNVSGSGALIEPAGSHVAAGADPANAQPATDYLSVTGGGDVTIALPSTTAVQFDWGSVDTYNTLIVHFAGGASDSLTGLIVAPPANGDQFNTIENGLFTFTSSGPLITGIELQSRANSFEVDNVSVISLLRSGGGIPEPASWTLMLLGMGGAGALLRRRRTARVFEV